MNKDQQEGKEDQAKSFTEPTEPGFEHPRKVNMDPVTVPLPPLESLKSFRLPKGYRLELVASEPMISEPAAIAWDGNGRMYVAQLETYMQTIDAKGQDMPVSRVILLEDIDDDGKMDKSSVFIDSLLSPRMILCIGNELFVNETNTYDIYAYRDENGDGHADNKRIAFSTGEKVYGNIEHQRMGLDWNIDNWIYVTMDPVRFRYKKGMLIPDSLTYGSNGQWGLTHDDHGRLFFSKAASGTAATGFQINPIYGQLDIDQPEQDSIFRMVWPGIKTPDANDRLRVDSTLKKFTAVCGQSVFRGDRLPENMLGNYFAAEPVGRIIRRAKISQNDGVITMKNMYDEDEFISSNDMNFRPVNTYTGPDGCLYIVDMYRGIIQESTWVQPDMPIYAQIKSKNLDKNVRNGRIYRLVYEGTHRGPRPRMLDEPSAKLVTYLDHPNGWWRDNAQKELIYRELKTVVPLLKDIVARKAESLTRQSSSIARLHALWTLEGLEAIDKEMLLKVLDDQDIALRKAAICISEIFIKKGDKDIIGKLAKMKNDPSIEIRAQLILTLNPVSNEEAKDATRDIFSRNINNPLISAIRETLAKNQEIKEYGSKLVRLDEPARKLVMAGSKIFNSLCVSCHGPNGKGLPTQVAPPLIGKFRLIENKDGVIRILLNGLTGPVDGISYPDRMISMASNDDEWIASVLAYMRYEVCMQSFPNMPSDYLDWVIIRPEEVKKIRLENADRKEPWTWDEILRNKKKSK